MPQLDVSTFPSQLFWLGVCFATLYVILSRFLLPRVSDILGTRDLALNQKINQASLYREEAESLLAEYEEHLVAARVEAQKKTDAALQVLSATLSKNKQKHVDSLEAHLHREQEKLHRLYRETRAEALAASEDIAEDILRKLVSAPKGRGK